MKQDQLHKKLSQKYKYQRHSPLFQSNNGNYKIYNGTHKDLAIPLTIKILNEYDQNLARYLNKLKDIKAQQNIKIYQVIAQKYLVVVTEKVAFANMGQNLKRYKKFDDQDGLFMCKYLLQGHMEALRNGIQWFGTLEDIQITQNGVKLSWNNGRSFTQQNVFPEILESISGLKTDIEDQKNQLLPFPLPKQIKELVKLSQTSASEISLNPLMKKKQKYIHKKIRDYLIIKQSKNNFDYYEQTVYLSVSQQYGFCRIKMYQNGKVQNNILELNKTKNTFTKVFDSFIDNNKFYIVSEYSNNGNLQNYINSLKNNGVQLKEQHIQFFFYSLFQPIKLIQQSNIKSLNMLHIKNIYLENGIPKIGEPVPLNTQIQDRLMDRSDVPDFFHRGFKRQPKNHDPTYDTYSLGVLLYKLMYTQYPIFPNSKVHIPTTPSYNSRLKKTLQLFLNEGGILSEIQKKIQVSQNVLNQVKQNKIRLLNDKKKLLKVQMKKNKQKRHLEDEDMEKHVQERVSQKTGNHDGEQDENNEDICCDCISLQYEHNTMIDPQVQSLHNSPYRFYRICTKFIILVLFYILLFYMFYIPSNFSMMFQTSSLTRHNVTISTVNYQIVITDVTAFEKSFNTTGKTLASLVDMGCYINNYNGSTDYGALANSSNILWMIYLISGIVVLIIIIVYKSVLVFKFDMMKVKHNIQANVSNFNMSNYIIVNLLIAGLINHHYYFYSIIFDQQISVCLGDKYDDTFSHAWYMFNNPDTFLYVHLPVFAAYFLVVFLSFIMVYKTDTIKYSKLYNPILLFLPFLLGYYIVVRIGVVSKYFYPSGLQDPQGIIQGYFVDGNYIGVIGIVPQLMFIAQIIMNWMVDWTYWGFIDKRRRILINQSSTQHIQVYN